MKGFIDYLDWYKMISNGSTNTVHAIGNDFILLDEPIIPKEFYQSPFKVDIVVGIICLKGFIQGKANLHPYHLEAPGLFVIMPEMVLEFEQISGDFEGRIVVMSKAFLANMNVENSGDAFVSISRKRHIPLEEEELQGVMLYYEMSKNIIKHNDNPYQIKTLSLLTMALFYGAGYYLHKLEQMNVKSKNEILFTQFMDLVQVYFTQQKGVDFYAEKLNLTPKYMSTQIKHISSKSAGEWIDERVMLEAKALLKSSNLTIQQIADKLNFPEQSAFGKFFKRHTGMSPKSYRNK